jgi:hypothetical protein
MGTATISIELGAKFRVYFYGNDCQDYVLKGTDDRGVIFIDSKGNECINVLSNKPYEKIEIMPNR